MIKRFIFEEGAIKLVKTSYSAHSGNNIDETIACVDIAEASNLRKELEFAISKVKEYRIKTLYDKISKSEKSIADIQADIDKWRNELKSFDAVD